MQGPLETARPGSGPRRAGWLSGQVEGRHLHHSTGTRVFCPPGLRGLLLCPVCFPGWEWGQRWVRKSVVCVDPLYYLQPSLHCRLGPCTLNGRQGEGWDNKQNKNRLSGDIVLGRGVTTPSQARVP